MKPGRRTLARTNYARFRALLAQRRRDRRFDIWAVTVPQFVIALALFAAGLFLLNITADPLAPAIKAAYPAALKPVAEFFNWFGEGVAVYVACVVLVVVSLVRDFRTRRPRDGAFDLTRVSASLYVLAATAGAGILAKLLKMAIGRARPRLIEEHGTRAFDMFGPGASWESFPSGHTTTVMSFAMALALLMPRWRAPILVCGVVVAMARVVTGAHYPSDVLGGCALGMAVSWLLARALARRRIVFRFDGKGRLKPSAYLGRAFRVRMSRASEARPGTHTRRVLGSNL